MGECGYISSQDICKACVMLTGLNKGLPQLGIGKSSKHKKPLQELLESSRSTSVASLTNGSGCTDSTNNLEQSKCTGSSCADSTNNLEQSKSTCTAKLSNGTSCADSIKDVDQSNSTCKANLTNGTSCTDSTN